MNQSNEIEFREFVEARLNSLGRFAYTLCRDWHQAEDTVQKALSRLYRKWGKVSRGSPDAYVRRIIINLIHDDRRLARFWREKTTTHFPEQGHGDPGDTEPLKITMLQALARLPKRQQQAVVLRHWEDLSVEETAAIMGCSTGTVKSQTARGLASLHQLLEDTLPDRRKEQVT